MFRRVVMMGLGVALCVVAATLVISWALTEQRKQDVGQPAACASREVIFYAGADAITSNLRIPFGASRVQWTVDGNVENASITYRSLYPFTVSGVPAKREVGTLYEFRVNAISPGWTDLLEVETWVAFDYQSAAPVKMSVAIILQ